MGHNYEIADRSLASEGMTRIEWASKEMPVLHRVVESHRQAQTFSGIRIAAGLPVSPETANYVLALRECGAQVTVYGSGIASTQDDIAAALAIELGFPTYAVRGESLDSLNMLFTGKRILCVGQGETALDVVRLFQGLNSAVSVMVDDPVSKIDLLLNGIVLAEEREHVEEAEIVFLFEGSKEKVWDILSRVSDGCVVINGTGRKMTRMLEEAKASMTLVGSPLPALKTYRMSNGKLLHLFMDGADAVCSWFAKMPVDAVDILYAGVLLGMEALQDGTPPGIHEIATDKEELIAKIKLRTLLG